MTGNAATSVNQARLRRGLTLDDLAEKCAAEGVQVTRATLSRIERSIHTPRPRLRAALVRLLDLPADYFERDRGARAA
ncbi:helix-turn-helix transcriptional regulator [Streptomyces rochei]|uniref:helix-turn-helix transcriptional regulator n=1 Tax=Streptomyces TaxID=1883 RepID=UPI001CBE2B32|nr:helix-turn-helix transcriptional regulator [Streptomyces sp. A144]UAX56773.1 helix-turn-helix domain-containing protein [Streptomyces sp. A144]